MAENDHVGEAAELYALGQLEDLERVRLERHVALCDACARRVGEAEATVLALIEAEATAAPPAPPSRFPVVRSQTRGWLAAAVAAAFVAGLVPGGIAALHERSASQELLAQTNAAPAAMLAGHFAHVPFVALAPGAPPAKAIYPREGGWLYVIVGPGSEALDLVVPDAEGGLRSVRLPPSDTVRTAFLAATGRPNAIELRAGDVTIAGAHVIYAR